MQVWEDLGAWISRIDPEVWGALAVAATIIFFVATRLLDRRERRLSEREDARHELARSGLYALPRTAKEADKFHERALQNETFLRRKFVQGQLRALLPADLAAICYLELPMRRALLRRWKNSRRWPLRDGHIELHAERGEGLTTLLADLAVEISSTRCLVVFGSFEELLRLWSRGQSHPQDLAHALGTLRGRGGSRKTVVMVLDDAPSRADVAASDSGDPSHYLAMLIQASESESVSLVIGTSTRSEQPHEETHTSWFGLKRQLDATPDPAERRRIGEYWVRLTVAPDDEAASVGLQAIDTDESLTGVIAAAWRFLRGTSFPYMDELLRDYWDLAEVHRDTMLLAALGRLVGAPVPESIVSELTDAKAPAEKLPLLRNLVTQSRVAPPGTGFGYELVSLVLAGRVIDDYLESANDFGPMLLRWIEGSPDDQFANQYWRLVLHRLASDEVIVANEDDLRRAAISAFNRSRISRLTPSDFGDRLSKLAYAATLRRMSRKESAEQFYNALLAEHPDFDGDLWFFASVVIGVIDCTPDQAQSESLLRLASDLAAEIHYLPTKMSLGLAAAFGDLARWTPTDVEGLEARSVLLGAAEALLAGHRDKVAYARQISATFASCVGGLYGDYYNRAGKARPDFDLALSAVQGAFEDVPTRSSTTDGKELLPFQSHVAHRIRARILDLRGLPGDAELADDDYLASFDVPDPARLEEYGPSYAKQYVLGAADHAFRAWKAGREEAAHHWYTSALGALAADIPVTSWVRANVKYKAARFFDESEIHSDLERAESLLRDARRESRQMAQDNRVVERLLRIARQRADGQMRQIESALARGNDAALHDGLAGYVESQLRIEELGRRQNFGREARRRLGQLLMMRNASYTQREWIAQRFAYRIVHALVDAWIADPDPRALPDLVNLIEMHGQFVAERDRQRLIDHCSKLPAAVSTKARANLDNALVKRQQRGHKTIMLEQYLEALT